ncbi:MAG: response regulator [Acidobacteriota bacterium]
MNGKRILIVDDEEYICDLVVDFLALEEISGIKSCDFESAIERAEKDEFDLIISDVNIGSFSVERFISTLRNKKIDTAVALMTGDHRIDDKFAAEIGAVGIIHKPFQVAPFLAGIKIFLETK